jgi:acetyl-CoA C-acetyltransferase
MMPAYYAMYAQAYLAKNGLTLDDLRDVRVKAASYGQINERAVYRKGVKPEDFDPKNPDAKLAGPVASPLRVGDCLCQCGWRIMHHPRKREKAKIFSKKPVSGSSASVCIGSRQHGSASRFFEGHSRSQDAAEQAYKMAGLGPRY